MDQLMPHVSYLEFQQQTDRPNLGYIFGKKQALMVDAGNSAAHVQQYMQALQAPSRHAAILYGDYALALGSYIWYVGVAGSDDSNQADGRKTAQYSPMGLDGCRHEKTVGKWRRNRIL